MSSTTSAPATATASSGVMTTLLEASPDGIVIVDAGGRVVGWNSAMLTTTALTAETISSATLETIDACLTLIDFDDALGSAGTLEPEWPRNIVTSQDGRFFDRLE